MTQHATISDHISYHPGEGEPIYIPQGTVQVDLTPDSAMLSWTDDSGEACLAFLPMTQYQEYVKQKRITPPL